MPFASHLLSLRQLQYACALADTLSFRRAAERCHVSQPSLSAQLADLERALGVRLFERNSKRVLVTPSGAELVARARAVLVGADDLVEAARRLGEPLAGTLRIGVIPTVSPYLLPSAARALRERYRGLSIVWIEDKTATVVRSLAAGELDAALLALEADPVREAGDLQHEAIAVDEFVLATPAGHPLAARRGPASSGELQGASVLLLDDGHCLRDQALSFCSEARAQELGFRATSLSTLAQMVAGGAGVTLLPRLSLEIEAGRADLALRPFAEPAPRRTIALVWRRTSALSAGLRQLAATIREAYPAGRSLPPPERSEAGTKKAAVSSRRSQRARRGAS